jgi:hypothetical protein
MHRSDGAPATPVLIPAAADVRAARLGLRKCVILAA